MTSPPGTSSNDIMEWPTLGKRGAIAKPTQQPTKKQRRRALRHWNFQLHLLLDKLPTGDMDKRIEAFFIPEWMRAYRENYGTLFHIQRLPTEGRGLYGCPQAALYDKTVRLRKKFVVWRNYPPCPELTRSVMEPLLGKEMILTYQNRAGKVTEMYPKVVRTLFSNSAVLEDPDCDAKRFTISFSGIQEIRIEVGWLVPNPEYRANWREYCVHCRQRNPGGGYCGCRD